MTDVVAVESAPDLSAFVLAVTRFGELARPDRSYGLFINRTGTSVDLSVREHRDALHKWLNAWGCRIRYACGEEPDLFDQALEDWWSARRPVLPPRAARLADLTDKQLELDDLAAAYGDLYSRAVARARGYRPVRAMGPTAATKALWAVRPMAVTAWDKQIAGRLYGGRDETGFRAHLCRARTLARALIKAAGGEEKLLDVAARPGSSLAKLIDEYWYMTFTRGGNAGARVAPPSTV